MSWRWISKQALLLHGESLAEHGGCAGLRDAGLLDSALPRPANLASYGTPDIAELAASYGFGVARNHPFVDGNKRAAFLAIGQFLYLNGHQLKAKQADAKHHDAGHGRGRHDRGRAGRVAAPASGAAPLKTASTDAFEVNSTSCPHQQGVLRY